MIVLAIQNEARLRLRGRSAPVENASLTAAILEALILGYLLEVLIILILLESGERRDFSWSARRSIARL
jgi:hypothetical protein